MLFFVVSLSVTATPPRFQFADTETSALIAEDPVIVGEVSLCPHACNGRGNCIQSNGVAHCECPEFFFGSACQFSNHQQAIAENPGCLNACSGRGICRSSDWTCKCDTGFEGTDCSTVTADGGCQYANYCSGNGLCHFVNEMFVCTCAPGFEGFDCSIALDMCGGCRHGLCSIPSDGASQCECFKGFSGSHCDEYSSTDDPCSSSDFCNGNGHCIEGTSVCICDNLSPGVSATSHCFLAPELAPTCPRTNGTVCNDAGMCWLDLTCACLDGYTGTACENEPCRNGCGEHGICMKQPNLSWMCSCDDGYAGAQCEIDTLAVSDSPCCEDDCSHQGTCKSCVCTSFDGFTGTKCETTVIVEEPNVTADLNR